MEPQAFTGDFASRLSFFSANDALRYQVTLGTGRERCTTPCSIDTHTGASEFTVSREGQRLTEEHVIPRGASHVLLRSYSLPMINAGVALMSLSATAVVVAVIFSVLLPYAVLAVLATVFAPAALVGGLGIVFTAVGWRRPTATFLPVGERFQ